MNIVADFAAACVAISIGYYAAASWAALRFAIRISSPPPLPKIAPLVAILKPLQGLTDDLRDKIVSYLELDYPRVEYYFGVTDQRDRAAEVPNSLRWTVNAGAANYGGRGVRAWLLPTARSRS